LLELDRDKALAEANEMMYVTKDVISKNNQQAQTWNTQTETTILNLLAQKRKEIIEFYG
jgi:hypothetical protein